MYKTAKGSYHMSDIFISYKREEQAIARKLANALESEGWRVWWDPKLRAGERFNDVIEKALNEATCVIVLWSKHSVESQYVKHEANYALKRNKLVPVMIEEVELPFRFEDLHTPSLFEWDGSKDSSDFCKLVEDIAKLIGLPFTAQKHEQPAEKQQDVVVLPADNAVFLRERESAWKQISIHRVWAIAGITPLSIDGDAIDPLSGRFREIYDNLRVFGNEPVNRTFTRPSEDGLLNEDLRNLSDGNGHRIEIFRNGHCEYLLCLQASVDQISEALRESSGIPLDAEKVIRYTDLADTIKNQLGTLSALRQCLPFREMTLSWMLLNVSNSIMYSHEGSSSIGTVVGFPIREPELVYREVVKLDYPAQLIEQIIRRIVNSFGLVLDKLLESNGKWRRPRRMT